VGIKSPEVNHFLTMRSTLFIRCLQRPPTIIEEGKVRLIRHRPAHSKARV
jgi:hypothetical protein